eukprot:3755526-Amphidinium_carterae.1
MVGFPSWPSYFSPLKFHASLKTDSSWRHLPGEVILGMPFVAIVHCGLKRDFFCVLWYQKRMGEGVGRWAIIFDLSMFNPEMVRCQTVKNSGC